MLFQNAPKFLSTPRLSPYLSASGGDEQKALLLYLDNLRLAQSFYIPLSFLEVALRNALHEVLERHFNSANWLLEQRKGFMIDNRLTNRDYRTGKTTTNDKILRMVETAIRDFEERWNYPPPSGSVLIADLNFGFWTTLFSRTYFGLLQKRLLRAFSHWLHGTERETLYNKLKDIRTFRNRVYHYEPLCFEKQSKSILCFSQLQQLHATILELLGWLDPALPTWLAEADRVPDTLRTISKKYPQAT
ncbi:MAG TPA: hypothetical protein VFO93_12620 [Hymenobacter sp.]|uniref:hypothetical protein n=1 Tax=Hymenobacter sp. TaxID=1898978 RepID=UPI002D80BEC8|nr:hypothetical protein [Hymenobacter sp.]HET9504378.1 hypothetical protein [Hymenobacter sp.]